MSTQHQVVIVGGGITGLACAHRLLSKGVDVLVLESGDRPGGKVETIRRAGYQFETGPNTLMSSRPELPQLITELGLQDQVVDASPAAKRRYVARNGRLHPLPMNPVAMLRSPLLGVRGVLQAAKDLRRTQSPPPEAESVASFIRRRFGPRVLQNLVGPFLTGVHAGDAERLEAASVLRQLVEAEQKHGSVIRGMLAERKAARAAGTLQKPRSITFRGGLDALPRALAEALGERLRIDTQVSWIEETPGGSYLHLSGGEVIRAQRVVLASSGQQAAALIQRLPGGENIGQDLARVRLASLAVLGLGYDNAAIPRRLDGFGYLAGPGTPPPVLGCLFRSTVFPHTAPAGKTLLTVFIGGIRNPEVESLSDEELIAAACAQLQALLGISATPKQVFIRRWLKSIPQYECGHAAMADRIRQWAANRPVSVVGSAFTGVSIPDCIAAARAEADRIATDLATSPARREQLCASA